MSDSLPDRCVCGKPEGHVGWIVCNNDSLLARAGIATREVSRLSLIARGEQAIANVRATPDGWNIAALEGITRELIAEVERLSATTEGAVGEHDRLRALLKQAHDRDKFQGEPPTPAWYDEVARYFKGQVPTTSGGSPDVGPHAPLRT